jgi:NAD(P)-dependent dehydrogenase (short-subunit alcohol dehydrogenase family)
VNVGAVVLITGGSRGIGAATAGLVARRGIDVCISYRAEAAAADAVVAECEAAGVRALAVRADVASERDVLALFAAIDEFGPMTGLVNNAGIVSPQARLEDYDAARVERIFAVNVLGAFMCAREGVRRMSTRRGGRGGSIVNVSSRASVLGSPNEYVDYAATKGAIDSMTIGLAKEVATEGIRVNAVRAGLIHTEIHVLGGEPARVDRLASTVPMARGGAAEEVARAIVWLLSAEASYTTGSFVDVSGGR